MNLTLNLLHAMIVCRKDKFDINKWRIKMEYEPKELILKNINHFGTMIYHVGILDNETKSFKPLYVLRETLRYEIQSYNGEFPDDTLFLGTTVTYDKDGNPNITDINPHDSNPILHTKRLEDILTDMYLNLRKNGEL